MQWLNVDSFHRNVNLTNGIAHWCKPCRAKYDRERRAKEPPGTDARRQRLRKYKLTDDRLDDLLAGGCNICGSFTRQLHIDHDHGTGKVRGALCGRCNIGLGIFGDTAEGLEIALAYLKGTQ